MKHAIQRPALRNLSAALILAMALGIPPGANAAEQQSYAGTIRQYVSEDKVYLLESFRQKATIPSEKLVIEALLSEDGPKAAELFQRQLAQFPDPALDQISSTRLQAYNEALAGNIPLPNLSAPIPERKQPPPASVPQRHAAPSTGNDVTPLPALAALRTTAATPPGTEASFAVQFGSFQSREHAQALAERISPYGSTAIIYENGMHKVRLARLYPARNEADAAKARIPETSIIIPVYR